ncbi:hypothetical protein EHP00_2373 [Ecytonucleospora hepatopenaei]|uniref:Uncharacterized protein n=1 Tax=Ecytonucleospora hepatopenaei TaxID=646526 RepID=A0A1W0E6M1_9MICR|nr:hypothetical protein EHP00_2373 [Ecytonucleospora hepatopenaei]
MILNINGLKIFLLLAIILVVCKTMCDIYFTILNKNKRLKTQHFVKERFLFKICKILGKSFIWVIKTISLYFYKIKNILSNKKIKNERLKQISIDNLDGDYNVVKNKQSTNFKKTTSIKESDFIENSFVQELLATELVNLIYD